MRVPEIVVSGTGRKDDVLSTVFRNLGSFRGSRVRERVLTLSDESDRSSDDWSGERGGVEDGVEPGDFRSVLKTISSFSWLSTTGT